METKPIDSWNEITEVIKGDIGEFIVEEWLLKPKGYQIYHPSGGSHPFDRLVFDRSGEVFIAEMKTKPHRDWYPDTGINYKHYQKYKNMMVNHNIDTFLYFVDEKNKKIYGNWLSILDRPKNIFYRSKHIKYPKEEYYPDHIIYFPCSSMEVLSLIPESIVEQLRNNTTRNYSYETASSSDNDENFYCSSLF